MHPYQNLCPILPLVCHICMTRMFIPQHTSSNGKEWGLDQVCPTKTISGCVRSRSHIIHTISILYEYTSIATRKMR